MSNIRINTSSDHFSETLLAEPSRRFLRTDNLTKERRAIYCKIDYQFCKLLVDEYLRSKTAFESREH